MKQCDKIQHYLSLISETQTSKFRSLIEDIIPETILLLPPKNVWHLKACFRSGS
jgi:hypothetical protein